MSEIALSKVYSDAISSTLLARCEPNHTTEFVCMQCNRLLCSRCTVYHQRTAREHLILDFQECSQQTAASIDRTLQVPFSLAMVLSVVNLAKTKY